MSAEKGNKYAANKITPFEKLNRPIIKRDWIKRDLGSFAGKKTIIKYNHFRMLNQSQNITQAQYKELGQTFRPNSEILQVEQVKSFLRNDQVQQIANLELAKVLSLNGISLDFLIKEKKDLLSLSKENKQLSVTLKTIESFENNLGLNNKVTISETRQTNSNLEQNYEKAKASLTVTKEISSNIPAINGDNGEKTRENTSRDVENEQKSDN